MIRTTIIVVALALGFTGLVGVAQAGGLDSSGANVHDRASLQRGAALFVNYCQHCHSAEFMRYERLRQDLDLTEDQVLEYLAFGDQELADYMTSSMTTEQATSWFDAPAPDLSLTARSRGGDWIYTFLRSFYLTEEGWNNTVQENSSMPHVLWELQGVQRPVYETETDSEGQERRVLVDLEMTEEGSLSAEEYDRSMRDLVAFMEYMAEPAILDRKRVGVWVLLFLSLLTFLSYLVYKEFWKDIK